jgi:hypothetical protein
MFNTSGHGGVWAKQPFEENAAKLRDKLIELDCFFPVYKNDYWNFYFKVTTDLGNDDYRVFLRLLPDGSLESHKVFPGNPEIEKIPMEEFLESVPERAQDDILFHLNLLTQDKEVSEDT